MAEEFQLGAGNWWVSASSSSSRNRFDSGGGSSSSSSSPAAAAASSALHMSSNSVSMGISSFGWAAPGEVVDIKAARSSLDSASATASGGVLVDPNLQIMGLGLSSQPIDWNQSLFRGEKGEQNSFGSMLQQQELSSNANYHHHHHQQETASEEQWRHRVLYSGGGGSDEASVNDYNNKQQMGGGGRAGFSLDQPAHEYLGGGASTCQGLNTSFELDSSYGSPSTILQAGLLVSNSNNNQPNFTARTSMSFPYNNTPANYGAAGDVMSSSWSNKFPQFLRTTSPPPPQQPQLHFSNNTTFWNATAAAMNDVRSTFFPSLHSQLPSSAVDEKPKNVSDLSTSTAAAAKKTSNETPSGKRSRNENPSPPMPPFKVRKEKMGDRITALQQLVSPFGKTDTASVLTEAIEYIKFLHDQVNALSAPYMKSGSSMQHQQQQISSEKSKDPEGGARQDLRSRGLCLVPVSSTFPVTHETTADFWSPTSFGGSFR
ncbi:PREDICTED: transcription factor bHLH123 isoform X2 [Ipomoea nil]|uniref:transcription factor bHLH123 isoform X2 n=1 Tax=Ipomoea nil TaxID=35883 RepID=UPI000901A4B8|nr:PREDICTED: transcription factor bHLH123 isoform X2 [Ipomoea nil]